MTDADVARTEHMAVSGYAAVCAWQVDALRAVRPDWDGLARDTRHALLSGPSSWPVEPFHIGTTSNLVTDAYLEEIASGGDHIPSHLALGDDASTQPTATDTSLNNEVYRTVVGQAEPDGADILTSTYISQNEANGSAIREVGFTDAERSGVWQLLSHALLDTADQIDEKTSNMTLTIDYVISFSR